MTDSSRNDPTVASPPPSGVEHPLIPPHDRAPHDLMPDRDDTTNSGTDHGDEDSIPRKVLRDIIRPIMAEEASRIFGPIAQEMRRDAERMERAVAESAEVVIELTVLANKAVDAALKMNEDRRHVEEMRREDENERAKLGRRLERIERHLWPDGPPA